MSTSAIMLRTGLPGAGKTLFTLDEVDQLAKREPDCAVYYNGIPDLRVPGWIELDDATQWHTLPQKSILIIDEAQRVFRPRHTGSTVPEHVAKLETIRHQGIRLFVITQHPKLIDPNVRRLCGDHRHYVRMFGSTAVNSHSWAEVNEDPDKSRADSMQKPLVHPKHVYGWYKSAEVHTVKRKVPVRLVLALFIPVLVAAAIWGAVHTLSRRIDGDKISQTVLKTKPGEAPTSSAPARKVEVMSPAEWTAFQQPRVPGLAYSAPMYDGITAPKSVPHPAACVSMGSRCSCYTEQATVLEVPHALCLQIVERGFFVPWQEPAGRAMRTEGGSRSEPPPRTPILSPLQAAPPSRPGSPA